MFRTILLLLLLLASTASAYQPSGSYRGRWLSNTTGHNGPMRVTIKPRSDGRYDARFSGRFALIIPFTYRTTMTPVESGPGYTKLVASKKMPLFGDYRMQATVTPCRVQASYTATKDRGVFTMSRTR